MASPTKEIKAQLTERKCLGCDKTFKHNVYRTCESCRIKAAGGQGKISRRVRNSSHAY